MIFLPGIIVKIQNKEGTRLIYVFFFFILVWFTLSVGLIAPVLSIAYCLIPLKCQNCNGQNCYECQFVSIVTSLFPC